MDANPSPAAGVWLAPRAVAPLKSQDGEAERGSAATCDGEVAGWRSRTGRARRPRSQYVQVQAQWPWRRGSAAIAADEMAGWQGRSAKGA
jgi:hypothetical protein